MNFLLIYVNIFLAFYSSTYYPLFQYLSSLIPVSTEGDGRYYYTLLQAILMGELRYWLTTHKWHYRLQITVSNFELIRYVYIMYIYNYLSTDKKLISLTVICNL
jgi:hypothetical protein